MKGGVIMSKPFHVIATPDENGYTVTILYKITEPIGVFPSSDHEGNIFPEHRIHNYHLA